ncbi:Chloride channel protein 2 [Tyrophagus putrescentiae]|nr:Chloride channel protein 2 [Tyrophagus putrescentiae]
MSPPSPPPSSAHAHINGLKMSSLARKQSMLGFEQTLMYGHYKEDLAEFARSHAAKLSRLNKRDERRSRLPGGKLFVPQLTVSRSFHFVSLFLSFIPTRIFRCDT